jgi:signal transduction histidine kinase
VNITTNSKNHIRKLGAYGFNLLSISNQLKLQMQPLTISHNNKTVVDYYPPPMNFDSYQVPVVNNKITLPPKKFKKPPVQFGSVLAHEVRNPLTNINLSVELLESETEHDRQPYYDIIKRSAARINDLVNELVKYQEANEAPAEKHSIHQLLDEVLIMAEDRLMLKHITIIKEYTAQDFEIILKRPKMIIALTNLIVNAVDAMPSENGRLKLVTKSMADKYVVKIEDNGCGISRKNLKHIFKPYFTNKAGGLGLGLSSTYEILRSNHIGVTVKSEEKSGTIFNLFFYKDPTVRFFNSMH